MSTQCSGSSAALEKAEVHTESIQPPVQPLDLAPRGSQVVQLRPVRAYQPQLGAKSVGGPTAVGGITAVNAPIISIARVSNMRSATLTPGQQPASITVTPISAANFGANTIRLSSTVSNGSWIPTGTGGQGTFSGPLRAAAITVGPGPRHVRPEQTKMIHLPQQGSVPQITQLQMVDPKTSILKPSINTPIVNIRGTLQGGASTAAQVLPITPFTIRTTSLANLSTIQQRPPQTSSSSTINQVQKVIAQPAHGTPIQLVSASNKNIIQTITPINRLNVSGVCLLSTNTTVTPNSSSPVVAVASKPGTAGLIMTPALTSGTGANVLPLTKVIPVGRDGSSSIVDSLFAQSNPSTSNAVTVSAVSASGTQASNSTQSISSASVVLTSPSTSQGIINSSGSTQTQSHQVIHVQGPINVHHSSTGTATVGVSLPPPSGSYYIEKNGNLNLVQTQQSRPITLEKRTADGKTTIPTGSMILTTQHPHIQSGSSGQTATVTIPIGAHGAQTVSFAHPISVSPAGSQSQIQGSAQIIATPIPPQAHHIGSTVLSTMTTTPAITVSTSSHSPGSALALVAPNGPPHSIPTQVISPPTGSVSASSSSSTLSNITVTPTVASSTAAANTNTVSSNAISVSVSLTSSNTLTTTSTSSTTTNSVSSASMSTVVPAQSPNTKAAATHSPRPSILRKQREISDNHTPARAQRNLTLQLNFAGSNTNSAPNSNATPTTTVASTAAAVPVVTPTSKENAGAMERGPPVVNNSSNNNSTSSASAPTTACNNSNNNNSNSNNGTTTNSNISTSNSNNNNNNNTTDPNGVSILRKEFQPPNEESSWQSCSSHSSGSTTISATSETAEYQIHQPISSSATEPNTHSTNNETTSSSSVLSGNPTVTPMPQNGVVRSITAGTQGKAHRGSSSKVQNKNIDRLKQDKEDSVSPRKKPRKQQLTSSDFLESVSPEISFYQGRGKKFKRMENNIFEGYNSSKPGVDPPIEESNPQKVVCVIKKPRISLLSSTNTLLGKTRLNHFEHYSEVKAKEERRPTISELANQKNIFSKVSGWKIQHMTNQMEQVVELEVSVVNSFNSLLTRLESKVGPNCPDRDINRILELLKGNIQRCKVIRDQMSDSRVQALKILDHKPRIVEVISKNLAKKPAKKKERL